VRRYSDKFIVRAVFPKGHCKLSVPCRIPRFRSASVRTPGMTLAEAAGEA